jgi:hypothetical protein
MPAGSRQARIDMYSLAHNVAVGAVTELISMVCQNGGQISGVIGFYPKGQVPQSRNTPSGQFALNYEIILSQGVVFLLTVLSLSVSRKAFSIKLR